MKTSITLEVQALTTPERDKIYLAGSINGWRPCDPNFAFIEVAKGRYQLTLQVTKGTILDYKLTRGSWFSVEVDALGAEQENRRLAVFGPTTVQIEVAHWWDQAAARQGKRARNSDIKVLGPFPIPSLNREREIVVYLPPTYYAEPARRFPVLYMFDGQNLFDAETAFNGEWRVDETCDRLIKEGKLAPVIVVGIYNGGKHRLSEQSPWRDARLSATGEGHAFLRWVVSYLKGFIDLEYRTLSDAENTGVGGSSMGGLTALYAAYRYPLVFGRAIVMSPALWFARSQIFRYVASQTHPEGAKIYLDCGEKEKARVHPKRNFYHMAVAMNDLLKQQGFIEGKDLKWVSDPQGTHNEWCWAARMGPALTFLWPGDGVPLKQAEAASTIPLVKPIGLDKE